VTLEQQLGTPNRGEKKSARVLALNRGVGVVYSDSPDETSAMYTLNWAYRADDRPEGQWQMFLIHEYTEEDGLTDRHGAHFNAAADSLGTVHVATRGGADAIYFRIPEGEPPSGLMTLANSGPYVQAGWPAATGFTWRFPRRAPATRTSWQSRRAGTPGNRSI
jgi:hypothetical protein